MSPASPSTITTFTRAPLHSPHPFGPAASVTLAPLSLLFRERCVRHEGPSQETLNVRGKREEAKKMRQHIVMLSRLTRSIHKHRCEHSVQIINLEKKVNILFNTKEGPTAPLPSITLWCKLSLECSLQKVMVTEQPAAGFALFGPTVETGSVQWAGVRQGPFRLIQVGIKCKCFE